MFTGYIFTMNPVRVAICICLAVLLPDVVHPRGIFKREIPDSDEYTLQVQDDLLKNDNENSNNEDWRAPTDADPEEDAESEVKRESNSEDNSVNADEVAGIVEDALEVNDDPAPEDENDTEEEEIGDDVNQVLASADESDGAGNVADESDTVVEENDDSAEENNNEEDESAISSPPGEDVNGAEEEQESDMDADETANAAIDDYVLNTEYSSF